MNHDRLRLLIWLQRGDEGYGVASSVLQFSRALTDANWRVVLVCIGEGELASSMREAGFEVEVLGLTQPPYAIRGNILQRAGLVARARWRTHVATQAALALPLFNAESVKSVKQSELPDVVQTMNVLQISMAGRCKEAISGVGVWRMAHGIRGGKVGPLARWLVRRPLEKYKIVNMGNSEHTTRSLRRQGTLSVSNPHGCDVSRFSPEGVVAHRRADYGIEESSIVLAIVARLQEDGDKGQDLVAAALARLVSKGVITERVHLLIVGGPTDTEFSEKVKGHSCSSTGPVIHLAGESAQVERFYPMVDVAINARVTAEPFGLSVVEAMLMGVPVLAHRLGGPSETIIDGKTGWLVDDSSSDAWYEALVRVFADRKKWTDFGESARKRALAEYTLEQELDRWTKQIDGIALAADRDIDTRPTTS